MKTYKDTEKEIQEGDRYFAVSYEVLPIVKKEDKYYAHIIMSCFDEQSEEEDCLMFEYLDMLQAMFTCLHGVGQRRTVGGMYAEQGPNRAAPGSAALAFIRAGPNLDD